MSEHTPTPWAVGHTLRTRDTQRWTDEQWERNESIERRLVFVNFRASDQGRSRERIAEFREPDDAEFAVRACNSYEDLLAALEGVMDHIEQLNRGHASSLLSPDRLDKARAAIDKARNTQVTGQGIRPASSD